ncbi:hypothetical protein [Catenulispora rubra]|uniref:hypothetical protein n=1 Tax=Catenulispora rubra TaxID=280293 RepID=UPI001891F4C3|nr:hypothetical protein [Catenulispora rubra]
MQSLPLALDRLHTPLCVTAPEPRRDPSGKILADHEGNPLWTTAIAVRRFGQRKPTVIDISTATEPLGVTVGAPLRIVELDAIPWALNGRVGISFKAAQILPHDELDW